jgi:hypothetical protein
MIILSLYISYHARAESGVKLDASVVKPRSDKPVHPEDGTQDRTVCVQRNALH